LRLRRKNVSLGTVDPEKYHHCRTRGGKSKKVPMHRHAVMRKRESF
jgi:hypothetical protein